MLWPPPTLGTRIEERIAWARACHEAKAGALLRDAGVRDLLDRLREAAAASHEAMSATGIVDICRFCDEKEGGSCCGAGLENHYDALLLLINRLLGVSLPTARLDLRSCYFLGPAGCLLQARHVLCVNYVCGEITSRILPPELAGLREKEGQELETLFLLHEQLRKTLKT